MNKYLGFIFSKYFVYSIQFINSLLIAFFLDPYFLGVYGFILLVIQYMSQLNFGISHASNAIISVEKERQWYVDKVVSTSFFTLIFLSIVIILLYVTLNATGLNIGSKFSFEKYGFSVICIGLFSYFNVFFTNVYRIYGKLYEVIFSQSLLPILTFFVIFLYREKELLEALVTLNVLSCLINFVLFWYRSPVKINLFFSFKIFLKVISKGFYLFVYNSAFYLILISTRSFISAFYLVEEYGFFTFAFSLATVVQLLLDSISFIIYPKMLNRFSKADSNYVIKMIKYIQQLFVTFSNLIIHDTIPKSV